MTSVSRPRHLACTLLLAVASCAGSHPTRDGSTEADATPEDATTNTCTWVFGPVREVGAIPSSIVWGPRTRRLGFEWDGSMGWILSARSDGKVWLTGVDEEGQVRVEPFVAVDLLPENLFPYLAAGPAGGLITYNTCADVVCRRCVREHCYPIGTVPRVRAFGVDGLAGPEVPLSADRGDTPHLVVWNGTSFLSIGRGREVRVLGRDGRERPEQPGLVLPRPVLNAASAPDLGITVFDQRSIDDPFDEPMVRFQILGPNGEPRGDVVEAPASAAASDDISMSSDGSLIALTSTRSKIEVVTVDGEHRYTLELEEQIWGLAYVGQTLNVLRARTPPRGSSWWDTPVDIVAFDSSGELVSSATIGPGAVGIVSTGSGLLVLTYVDIGGRNPLTVRSARCEPE